MAGSGRSGGDVALGRGVQAFNGLLQGWFDRHPWVYGFVFALPLAVLLVVVRSQEGALDDLRT